MEPGVLSDDFAQETLITGPLQAHAGKTRALVVHHLDMIKPGPRELNGPQGLVLPRSILAQDELVIQPHLGAVIGGDVERVVGRGRHLQVPVELRRGIVRGVSGDQTFAPVEIDSGVHLGDRRHALHPAVVEVPRIDPTLVQSITTHLVKARRLESQVDSEQAGGISHYIQGRMKGRRLLLRTSCFANHKIVTLVWYIVPKLVSNLEDDCVVCAPSDLGEEGGEGIDIAHPAGGVDRLRIDGQREGVWRIGVHRLSVHSQYHVENLCLSDEIGAPVHS
mmetsp:Transcript_118252/g.280740  ORF Transcript_118252/g.280740 Transcript_118252/m.280740 type:complete len:278 (-) Transcript_118252:1075-1908(-)